MVHDKCYYKVMRSYGRWSARAAQAVSKCRKKSGHVRKTEAGKHLKHWENQHWKNMRTGRPCGNTTDKGPEYCRPSGAKPKNLRENIRRKKAGLRAKRAT